MSDSEYDSSDSDEIINKLIKLKNKSVGKYNYTSDEDSYDESFDRRSSSDSSDESVNKLTKKNYSSSSKDSYDKQSNSDDSDIYDPDTSVIEYNVVNKIKNITEKDLNYYNKIFSRLSNNILPDDELIKISKYSSEVINYILSHKFTIDDFKKYPEGELLKEFINTYNIYPQYTKEFILKEMQEMLSYIRNLDLIEDNKDILLKANKLVYLIHTEINVINQYELKYFHTQWSVYFEIHSLFTYILHISLGTKLIQLCEIIIKKLQNSSDDIDVESLKNYIYFINCAINEYHYLNLSQIINGINYYLKEYPNIIDDNINKILNYDFNNYLFKYIDYTKTRFIYLEGINRFNNIFLNLLNSIDIFKFNNNINYDELIDLKYRINIIIYYLNLVDINKYGYLFDKIYDIIEEDKDKLLNELTAKSKSININDFVFNCTSKSVEIKYKDEFLGLLDKENVIKVDNFRKINELVNNQNFINIMKDKYNLSELNNSDELNNLPELDNSSEDDFVELENEFKNSLKTINDLEYEFEDDLKSMTELEDKIEKTLNKQSDLHNSIIDKFNKLKNLITNNTLNKSQLVFPELNEHDINLVRNKCIMDAIEFMNILKEKYVKNEDIQLEIMSIESILTSLI